MIPRLLVALGVVATLAAVNLRVVQLERALASGQRVLLPIAGYDPRSLMQGDYWRFTVDLGVAAVVPADARRGTVILVLDDDGLVRDVAADDGRALGPAERRAVWTRHGDDPRLIPEEWFIEEGTADDWTSARRAEARITPDGVLLLTGLTDEDGRRLGPLRRRW